MVDSASSAPDAAEYTRLHITPLTPALLHTIIPPSILPSARNISYHTIETFPERAYGFLELPVMDAEKVKKKLNGSILKGTKVKIEAARPIKEFRVDQTEEKPERVRKEGSKKRKRAEETIPGVDIGARSVKRGWTTPTAALGKLEKKDKEKKAYVKSKYTTGKECLFKTVLPPNVASKTKSTKDAKSDKKRKGKPGKETVVHEFAKTTKYATFLRGPAGSKKTKAVAEYVEGKGWVDDEGNLVEEVLIKPRKIYEMQNEVPTVTPPEDKVEDASPSEEESSADESTEEASSGAMEIDEAPPAPASKDFPTSSSGSSSDEEESESSNDEERTLSKVDRPHPVSTSSTSSPSSSGTSSEEDSEASSDSSSKDENEESSPTKPPVSNSRPQSSPGLTIEVPSPPLQPSEVHPLEALYKRAKSDAKAPAEPTAATSSFSFFGADADEDSEEEAQDQAAPLTPFTQKDFENRGLRSAAPTPDTAHANKRFIWPIENGEDHEDITPGSSPSRDSAVEGDAQKPKGNGAEEESEFQKWFWKNRGETNRAWKKRRKVAGKEKRQRENRKREGRGI